MPPLRMASSIHLWFLFLHLIASVSARALLSPQTGHTPFEGTPPHPPTSKNRLSLLHLFKRNCVYQNGGSCDTGYCCWRLDIKGGFCCGDGGCCGNGCCGDGFTCAWAGPQTSSCCAIGSDCGDMPTVTAFVTNIETQLQTEFHTEIRITSNIVTISALSTATQTQFSISSATIVVPSFITPGGAGTAAGVTTSGQGAAPPAQTAATEKTSDSSTPIAVIVGGVIGGVALLALLVFLIVVGVRRGWFEKKERYQAPPSTFVSGIVPPTKHYASPPPAFNELPDHRFRTGVHNELPIDRHG